MTLIRVWQGQYYPKWSFQDVPTRHDEVQTRKGGVESRQMGAWSRDGRGQWKGLLLVKVEIWEISEIYGVDQSNLLLPYFRIFKFEEFKRKVV